MKGGIVYVKSIQGLLSFQVVIAGDFAICYEVKCAICNHREICELIPGLALSHFELVRNPDSDVCVGEHDRIEFNSTVYIHMTKGRQAETVFISDARKEFMLLEERRKRVEQLWEEMQKKENQKTLEALQRAAQYNDLAAKKEGIVEPKRLDAFLEKKAQAVPQVEIEFECSPEVEGMHEAAWKMAPHVQGAFSKEFLERAAASAKPKKWNMPDAYCGKSEALHDTIMDLNVSIASADGKTTWHFEVREGGVKMKKLQKLVQKRLGLATRPLLMPVNNVFTLRITNGQSFRIK